MSNINDDMPAGTQDGLGLLLSCSWGLIATTVILSVLLIFLGAAKLRSLRWQLFRLAAGLSGLWYGIQRLNPDAISECGIASFQTAVDWCMIVVAGLILLSAGYKLLQTDFFPDRDAGEGK